jgi:hypothetical protein
MILPDELSTTIRTNYALFATTHGFPSLASLVIQFAEGSAGRATYDRERLQALLKQTSAATDVKTLEELNRNYIHLRRYHADEFGEAAIAAAESANLCKLYTLSGPSKDTAMALAKAEAVTDHAARSHSDQYRLRQTHLSHIQAAQQFGLKSDQN